MATAVLASLAAMVAVVLLVAWWLFDAEQVREKLETELGDTLAMDVQIGQTPRLGLLRGASLTLGDLEISRQGQPVATVDRVHVRIGLLSLLSGSVRPLEIHLHRPVLSIERLSPGVFNVYPSETEAEPSGQLSLPRLRLSEGRLDYLDKTSDLEWLFEQCDLDLRNIRHGGGQPAQASATLGARGELQCQKLTQTQSQLVIPQPSLEIRGDDGVFELILDSATVFEGQGLGRLEVDFTSNPPEYKLTSSLSQIEVGDLMAMLEAEQDTSGTMDIELALNARGTTWHEVRNSATGSLSMTARELLIDGFDLDDELDGYAKTQRFNLVDVGAVFLAGPVGLVASRGYAFGDLLARNGGSTRIDQMVSEWAVEDGHARTRDVAFRTPENRLALVGGLDLAEYRFDDLQVAVLDGDGCAVVEQMITGPFREPEVEQPNFLVTVAGPLLDLIERGIQAITDEDCEVFYDGAIQHP